MQLEIPQFIKDDDELFLFLMFVHWGFEKIGQKRKYSGLPYAIHVIEVAKIVKEYYDNHSMIFAALGHDTLEDQNPILPSIYNEDNLYLMVGRKATDLIIELTDVYTKEAYPHLNRKARHELEAKRLGTISAEAQTIKAADILHNTSDIMQRGDDFKWTYLKEAKAKALQLTKADKKIMDRLWNQLLTIEAGD